MLSKSLTDVELVHLYIEGDEAAFETLLLRHKRKVWSHISVSYTHLRAHETVLDLVCRLLLEKKKENRSWISLFLLITQKY